MSSLPCRRYFQLAMLEPPRTVHHLFAFLCCGQPSCFSFHRMPMITRQRVQDAVESKQFINQVFNFIDKRGAWKTRPEACIVAVRRMQQVKKFSGMLENAKAVGFFQEYLMTRPRFKRSQRKNAIFCRA